MYEKIKTRRDMKDSFIYENTETTSTRKGFEKHVRLLLSLVFFAVIGVGNVWGATATLSGFANATPAATSGPVTVNKGDYTIDNSSNLYASGSNRTFSIDAGTGNTISSISLTMTGTSNRFTATNITNCTACTRSNSVYTITISPAVQTVSLKNNGGAVTITQLVVTYETSGGGCSAPTSPSISGTTAYDAGDDILLTASATGTSGTTTYTWYKGVEWATASATTPVQAASTSGATFTKASCGVGDAGTYWCNISNGTGCDVQVSQTISVACTPITPSLSYTSTTLTAGGAASSLPTLDGNTGGGSVTYSITNPQPAGCVTVDAATGVVTPIAEGTATITATVESNNSYCAATATAAFTIEGVEGLTLTNTVSPASYGTVSPTSVVGITSGAATSTNANTYTVGGTTVTATPAEATAEYTYAFDSWQNLPATVTENATVTANFTRTAKSYTLAWSSNGGSALTGTYTNGVTAYGSAITAPNAPTLAGYTFGGWYTNNDGTGTASAATMPAANTAYYAKWTQSVTLDANTANGGDTDGSATATLNGTSLTGVTHATAATGYSLNGYYTSASGGTKVLNADGSYAASDITDYVTSGKWVKAGATTLYAQYDEAVAPANCDMNFWFFSDADQTSNGKTNATSFFSNMVSGSSNLSGSIEIDGTTYNVTRRSGDVDPLGGFTIPDYKTGTFYALAVSSGSSARQIILTNTATSDTYPYDVAGGSSAYTRVEIADIPAGTYTINRGGGNTRLGFVAVKVCDDCTPLFPTLSYGSTTLTIGNNSGAPTLTGNTSGGTVSYSSSNTAVATVDPATGVVSAIATGTAWIKATINKTGVYCSAADSVEFTVNCEPQAALSASSITVTEYRSTPLSVTGGSGSGALTYTSNNTGIATVNGSGTVTGVAAGTTSITVTKEAQGIYCASTPINVGVTVEPIVCTDAAATLTAAANTYTLGSTGIQLTYTSGNANAVTYTIRKGGAVTSTQAWVLTADSPPRRQEPTPSPRPKRWTRATRRTSSVPRRQAPQSQPNWRPPLPLLSHRTASR